MLKNYFKIAWRSLFKNKLHSFINISGLSVGMAVAILIALWVFDELHFNKSFENHDRIAQVSQNVKFTDEKVTYTVLPIPLAAELRNKYPDFKTVSLSVENRKDILSYGKKIIVSNGNYVEPGFTEIFSLQMLTGKSIALKDMHSILLSGSMAKMLFGSANAVNQVIKINNKLPVKVAGVFDEFPKNSQFSGVLFLAPWDLYVSDDEGARNSKDHWDDNSWQIYAQLKEGADFQKVSDKIRDIRMKLEDPPKYKPEFFLHPMNRWHLYSEFKNGVNTGGFITYVRLFGIIGVFVLLLACINFMNLSTARSEKRAKEVGIRKSIGSSRLQLILQFLNESLVVVLFAFAFALILVLLLLPFFNQVADKTIHIPLTNPIFWLACLVFCLLTGLVAGSYPALYLSSFEAVKVLKGTIRAGKLASLPRKVMVVMQFSISVILIIGTIVVFRQIQYAKNRPVGYDRNGMIEIQMNSSEMASHFESLRMDLIRSGAVSEVSESSGSVTVQYGGTTNVNWTGKAPDSRPLLMSNHVTHEYGKTVGWHIAEGRDFSKSFSTDTSSIIVNEAAIKIMALKNPLQEFVKYNGKKYQVIGIVKDMVKLSPFEPIGPTFYVISYKDVNTINIRLTPRISTTEAIGKIENIFKVYNPASPFSFSFVDEDYGKKFSTEERIGKLSSFFAILAVFISCMGLFGMASFTAEQRTKEIGVRKVLGATILSVWGLLSKEFIALIFIALLIAIPLAYYFMNNWLQNYQYRNSLSVWVFIAAGAGSILITLLTVSYQAIRAGMANPVKSLRSE